MKINRPLSPHLTIYTPQLTSTLSIFHRITGAFMASTVLLSVLCLKMCDLNLTFYPFYWCTFCTITYFNWLIFGLTNLVLLALCYHMSNGIRHLLWDFGFFLDLPKVYTSGIIMLMCALLLGVLNILRIYG
jgi:succinate dehydrogenase cytochrome b556 subunit